MTCATRFTLDDDGDGGDADDDGDSRGDDGDEGAHDDDDDNDAPEGLGSRRTGVQKASLRSTAIARGRSVSAESSLPRHTQGDRSQKIGESWIVTLSRSGGPDSEGPDRRGPRRSLDFTTCEPSTQTAEKKPW